MSDIGSLFKYRPINKHTMSSIMEGKIYFSLPDAFNDPFDSSFSISLPKSFYNDPMDFMNRIMLNEYELRKSNEATHYRIILTNLIGKGDMDEVVKFATKLLVTTYRYYMKKPGISCLSEVNDNILMWSHYSDYHKGVCLEYDATKEPFIKYRKITYTNQYCILTNHIPLEPKFIVKPYLCKSKLWEYESELRLFRDEGEGVCDYDSSALLNIYFGCRCEESDIRIFKAIVSEASLSIGMYKAVQTENEYRLDFNQIN